MKEIKLNKSAKVQLLLGVDAVADAVRMTLGPKGRNAIIGRQFQTPEITNDGVSIAKEVELEDTIANMGAQVIREVAQKTSEEAGDGTTTATTIAQSIIHTAMERLDDITGRTNAMTLRKEIMEECDKVVAELKTMAKPIKTDDEIKRIATFAGESEEVGKIVLDAIKKIGNKGVITVEDGGVKISSEVLEGMQIDRGWIAPIMATDAATMKAEVKNPYILITDKRIGLLNDLVPIIKKLAGASTNELVVIADEISDTALQEMIVNKIQGRFKFLAIEAPGYGDRKRAILEDIAVLTNGKVISDTGKVRDFKSCGLEDLGRSAKVISSKETTTIIGGQGDVKGRIKELEAQLTHAEKYDKDEIGLRIAKLSGGVAVIYAGANSEAEIKYLKKKIENAVNATKAAIEEGVVHGGGMTLKKIAEKLPSSIITEALHAPYKQIQENAGELLEIGKEIIDPVKVTRTAVQNACSVAGILITTEVAIGWKDEKKCACTK